MHEAQSPANARCDLRASHQCKHRVEGHRVLVARFGSGDLGTGRQSSGRRSFTARFAPFSSPASVSAHRQGSTRSWSRGLHVRGGEDQSFVEGDSGELRIAEVPGQTSATSRCRRSNTASSPARAARCSRSSACSRMTCCSSRESGSTRQSVGVATWRACRRRGPDVRSCGDASARLQRASAGPEGQQTGERTRRDSGSNPSCSTRLRWSGR